MVAVAARKAATAAAATSAPSPKRPAGILVIIAAFCDSFKTSVMGEAMKPGAIVFAMANPDPEIRPEEADGLAAVIAVRGIDRLMRSRQFEL
ncbi:hypothetical protein HC776_00720 [bacterium]|nr:hypothetical protein [bacterium]